MVGMLPKIVFFLFVCSFLGCGSGKDKGTDQKKAKVAAITATALSFSGTPYRYGGVTRQGMDCSGLVYTALKQNGIAVPRTSYQMAREGKRIHVTKVQKGDLLYFKTGKNRRRINHVGLVVEVQDNHVTFIHATTSRGVLVSSLREGYWNRTFVKAMRIL